MKSVARISGLGMMLSCPEEITYRMGFIDRDTLRLLAVTMRNNQYGAYLLQLLDVEMSSPDKCIAAIACAPAK